MESRTSLCLEPHLSIFFGSTPRHVGYFYATPLHAIRRQLGKKADERYTEVHRSQHLMQGDPRVFKSNYVVNTPFIDGKAASLDEMASHIHSNYL